SEDQIGGRDCWCGGRHFEALFEAPGPNLNFRPDARSIADASLQAHAYRAVRPGTAGVPRARGALGTEGKKIVTPIAVDIRHPERSRRSNRECARTGSRERSRRFIAP